MISLETKTQILHDLYIYGEDEYSDFIDVHDIGVPLAMLIVQGHAQAAPSGVKWIETDFDDLCEYMEIDKYGEYESLDEMISLAEG